MMVIFAIVGTLIFVVLFIFCYERFITRPFTKDLHTASSMLNEWIEGLSRKSGVSKEQLMKMPTSEVEKLRQKYNYK